MRDFRQVPRIERPPDLQQEAFRQTRFDEKRIGADTTRAAQIAMLCEIGHDDDHRRANIVPLPHGADESEPIEVQAGEDEFRDDDLWAKGSHYTQCSVWTGHATRDHAVVSEEGRMHQALLGMSIDDEHPTGLIDASETSHIVGLATW